MKTDKIAILIKVAALEFDKIANQVLSEYRLTASQYRVLKYLYAQPDASVRVVDVEKECSITHPTVLGLLDNLTKKGFITKIINQKDARSKVISLTKKAREMQSELEEVGDRLDDMLAKNLSDKEKEQLIGLFQKLLKMEGDAHADATTNH